MFYLEILLGKFLLFLCHLIDKNRGTNIVGEMMMKLDKRFISKFKVDPSRVVVITGTNGKSTATNLLSHIFKKSGRVVVSNLEGANLIGGIATILLKNSTFGGGFRDAYFIFEIDERTLPYFFANIKAKNLAVTNIQKDQVCRNGDLDYIYQIIKKIITPDMRLFLNSDEPRSKSFEKLSSNIVYYGVNKHKYSFSSKKDMVTVPCPVCYSKIAFDYYNIANIGKFHCTACDYRSEKELKYFISSVDFKKGVFTIGDEVINMPYVEAFMLYGYALVYAVASEFGVENIGEKFESFQNVSGRIETLQYKNKSIKYIRIKQENPETLQSALDAVAKDKKDKVFILGLCLLKDFKPYYSNTFYSYDCDFTNLINSNVEKFICFSEVVSYDTANRLLYAGVDKNKITIINNDNVEEILEEACKAKTDNIYLITWLHTYEDIEKYLKGMN